MNTTSKHSVSIAIIYHSEGGHVAALAKRIVQGAQKRNNTIVDCFSIDECHPRILVNYDGIALGCPTRFGNISAAMKLWLEKSIDDWYQNNLQDKIGASFTVSGGICGDKAHTLSMINHFFLMHGCIVIGNPQSEYNTDRFVGVGAKTRRPDRDGCFFEEKEGLIAEDLGQRLAEITHRFHETKIITTSK